MIDTPVKVEPSGELVPDEAVDSLCRILHGLRSGGPLERYALLEKVARRVEEVQKGMLRLVNAEAESRFQLGQKSFVVNGCMYKPYTRPPAWIYPEDVLLKTAQLAALRKEAQETGSATKDSYMLDPDKDKQFSVQVVE